MGLNKGKMKKKKEIHHWYFSQIWEREIYCKEEMVQQHMTVLLDCILNLEVLCTRVSVPCLSPFVCM